MSVINILILSAAYFIGAIPFGVIAAKICRVDIFKIGSGSTGATNVIRACGKSWGYTVMALDVAKGTLATWLGIHFFANNYWLIVLCGLLAMLGHAYSIFIGFRGGKAAATGIGILLALNPKIFVVVAILMVLIRQTTGYQSLASLIPSLCAPFLFFFWRDPVSPLPYTVLVALGALFVWLKHIPNIKRLLAGTESRITGRKR